jgi:hypothetical protein
MLLLRVALLAGLICLHVVGGAVVFRKLFPRESPWWGFFLPTLGLVALLDFIEHGLAASQLFWLLPFSTVALVLMLARAGRSWKALRLPGAVFLGVFAFTLTIKCLQPDINFYFTEGMTDTNRILDFCLGDRLPPTDSWLPPYAHSGYYTFMHYGASVLKRLLGVDVGTACNLSSALVSALMLVGAGAAAYSLSRGRVLVTILVVAVVAGGFTGSSPWLTLLRPADPMPIATIDIGGGVDDPPHAIFSWFLKRDAPDIAYRLYTPGSYIYYPEFHATMGGELVAIWLVFAAAEVLLRKRAIFPWIYLIVAPFLAFITCSWDVFMVIVLAGLSLVFAWLIGRWPSRPVSVAVGAALGVVLLWPAVNDLTQGSARQSFHWSMDLFHDCWTLVFQWWPIYLPWLALCLAWKSMNVPARWLHFVFVPVMLCTELFFVFERGTMLEKTWGCAFGMGMVMLYPALFRQKGWACRALAAVIMLTSFASLGAWANGNYTYAGSTDDGLYLEGDHFLKGDPVLCRMKEVLSRIQGCVVLTGQAHYAWFESPVLPMFTGNRCYLGWTNAEEACGRASEADFRQQQINDFYAGKMTAPLSFLKAGDIAAVMVWPDDKISDAWLESMKTALASEYTYFDCRGAGADNAGIFLRNPTQAEARLFR